jgi:mRNA interferase RelE/StbE
VYQVVIERRAEKEMDRLAQQVRRRVVEAILGLASDPRPSGCRKLFGSNDDWRIRVGDYRIIYQIVDAVRVVRVNRVRHRREVYR